MGEIIPFRDDELTEEEQREMDAILLSIGEMIEEQESGLSVVNEQRALEFVTCESYLRKHLKGKGLRIEAIPNDGYASVGVIRVLAKELIIEEPERFAKVAELASNYEIYPRTDGKIMLAFTFYGMTNKIGG